MQNSVRVGYFLRKSPIFAIWPKSDDFWLRACKRMDKLFTEERLVLNREKPDEFDVDAGAYKLAVNLAIQALVEHASDADQELRARITLAMEAYIEKLNPQSEREKDFAARAQGHVASLIRPISSGPRHSETVDP